MLPVGRQMAEATGYPLAAGESRHAERRSPIPKKEATPKEDLHAEEDRRAQGDRHRPSDGK